MYILMLGAQGTGKGTVAGVISSAKGWPQISTGDIFRKNISEKTELGIKANEYISKGMLVPDDVTVPMVEARLAEPDAQDGAILDGFPRTIEQAEELDKILAKMGKKIDLALNLVAPKEELIERMVNRRVCSNQACKEIYNLKTKPSKVEGICDKCGAALVQRQDDSDEEAINQRLEIYETKTRPLVDYYAAKGVLRTEDVSSSTGRFGTEVAKELLENM